MKLRHLFICMICVFFLTRDVTSWSYRLGSSTSNEQASSIVATSDGGFAVAGLTQSNSNLPMDVTLHVMKPNGSIRWQRQVGDATKWDSVSSILQTKNGEFFITGNRMMIGREYDAWFALFSSDGNSLWQKTMGGINWDGALAVEQTKDGGFIIAGYYGRMKELLRHSDGWLIKLNSQGNIEWHRSFDLLDEYFWSIRQTSDGGYIAAGQTMIPGRFQNDDVWILKFTAAGNIQWKKVLKGLDFEVCVSIIENLQGGYVAVGRTASFGRGGFDVWVISLTSAGKVEWQKTYGGRYNDEAIAIVQTSDMNLIVAANTESFGIGNSDIWILKLDPAGNVLWQKTVGTTQEEHVSSIAVNRSGIIIAATSDTHGSERGDILLIRMNQKGELGRSCLTSVNTMVSPQVSRARSVNQPVVSQIPSILFEPISLLVVDTRTTPQRTCGTEN
jgi:hypothetical protein